MTNICSDMFLRPLPCYDSKWLRADILTNLRSLEDTAVLWNCLIQDCELLSSPGTPILNDSGNISYLGDDGKHYCGVEKLDCSCCNGYCGPLSSCNCKSCRQLDSESAIKKLTSQSNLCPIFSDSILESWLWNKVPNSNQRILLSNTLLAELHNIAYQSAGNCLSSIRIRHLTCIYERYLVALGRLKPQCYNGDITSNTSQCSGLEVQKSHENHMEDMQATHNKNLKSAKFGLARVGTRAALHFSFAFLRRAWRSGEDAELCRELLLEALETLQELPEASLFDTSEISLHWIDVLERSIKFLREVVLGDIMIGRLAIPREDRHIAISLLLQLGLQKANLGATLEGIVLLLTLWEMERKTEDNRDVSQNIGAPLVPILKRYEMINKSKIPSTYEPTSASATESFLRFLTLPDHETAYVDLKQAAVVIISHLDRLAKPHMPCGSETPSIDIYNHDKLQGQNKNHEQFSYVLGLKLRTSESHRLTSDPLEDRRYFNSSSFHGAPCKSFEFVIKEVCFSEDLTIFLSKDGKVYTWRTVESEDVPVLVDTLSNIVRISAHWEGKHYLALDSCGKVYSWGIGESGRLGHGDVLSRELPTKIQHFHSKDICNIYCGCTYSAALCSNGKLYTWGRGTYGRLGHGNSDDKLTPFLVQALYSYKVVDVALGCGDAHSLCVTDEGEVFSWGDGDYGKLGNGSCNGSSIPIRVEGLPAIQRVFIGSQFSAALSREGKIFTWGKGYSDRLGLGVLEKSEQSARDIVNIPKLIVGLRNKVIVDMAVGSAHCMALSTSGELFVWGHNDFQQICPESLSNNPIISSPMLIAPSSMCISGIACGATRSMLWCRSTILRISAKIPFVVDLSEHTFRILDQLLGMVCAQEIGQTPNQESECIVVACLNLLRLQLYSLITNKIPSKMVGLEEGSKLLISLKSKVLNLAGGANVLKTMQEAAQLALQVGWSVLLPTVSERSQTLSSLLPSEPIILSPGHRFMTDLLVQSLMAGGGLELALYKTIATNFEQCTSNNEQNLPLFRLIKQLLRNNATITQAKLCQLFVNTNFVKDDDDVFLSKPNQTSPSLDLLHRFQGLLLSNINQSENDDVHAVEVLLGQYVQILVPLCMQSLQKAQEVAVERKNAVVNILKSDVSDSLLNELIIGLVIINRNRPTILSSFEWAKIFLPLLHALDNFNRVLWDCEIQDIDDLGWPGLICRNSLKAPLIPEEQIFIRNEDIVNHIEDGGKWIILNGFVCNVQNYQSANSSLNKLIESGLGTDLTADFINHRQSMEYIVNQFKIGKHAPCKVDEQAHSRGVKEVTHYNTERMLAFLLGLRACNLQNGTTLQPAELQCKSLLKCDVLRGGLQMLQPTNPFDEEKSEARSSASTAESTPTEPSYRVPSSEMIPHMFTLQQRVDVFIGGLGEGRLSEPLVSGWNAITERFYKENNIVWHQEFQSEHPVQDVERLLTAVLIRHQNLGPLVLAVIDRELGGITDASPAQVIEIIRFVNQTKWSIVRSRQQLNRSYKEVCAPIIERLKFLLYEVRPAVSLEQFGLRKLCLLYKTPRFKHVVKRIISDIRVIKKQAAGAKPEDILNVTIQSQNGTQNREYQENLYNISSTDGIEVLKATSIENISTLYFPQQNRLSNDNLVGTGIFNGKKASGGDRTMSIDLDFTYKKSRVDRFFVNDVILKLSEKSLKNAKLKLPSMLQLVDFAMQDECDVETIRRAMYCQLQRYHIRLQGIQLSHELFKINSLLDSVQYNMLSGYLGLHLKKKNLVENILEDLNMITAFQKANLILMYEKVMEWSLSRLQELVNQEQILLNTNMHGSKDNSNLGTYVFLKKMPRARFLLSVFGILAKDVGHNELGFLINSGILGTILGLLRQTGGDTMITKNHKELSVVYEDTIMKQKSNKAHLTGCELAKLMKIGTRICRGADWKWGDQDGNPPGEGRIISEVGEDGWVRVEWDTGTTNSYRMGKEGQYDLQLADSASNIVSPECDIIKEDSLCDTHLNGESHPTKLLRHACIKMVQIISIAAGKHSEKLQKSAILGLTSMFRAFLTTQGNQINLYGSDTWRTIGFLRSICGNSVTMSNCLKSPIWIKLFLDVLNDPIKSEQDVYRKVHCLRLLQSIVVNWNDEDVDRCVLFIQQLFSTLGKLVLYCRNDVSLTCYINDSKYRVLATASHTSTVAEEIVTLLRKFHTLPLWNSIINSFMSQKLCVVGELFNEGLTDASNAEHELISVMGVLSTIGGCDVRPRIGLQVYVEDGSATLCGFNSKGKCLLSADFDNINNYELRKMSLTSAIECANHSVFSLSRLPLNEILLNSWAALIYGSDDKNDSIPRTLDISVLRAQQVRLACLNANCILYRHQSALRKILRQKSPEAYVPSKKNKCEYKSHCNKKNMDSDSEGDLLIKIVLNRAIQPSPLSATYSYQELAIAGLNVSQILANKIQTELYAPASNQPIPNPHIHSTSMHRHSSYNYEWDSEISTVDEDCRTVQCTSNSFSQNKVLNNLISQIMEMGFSKICIEKAIKAITSTFEVYPTPEQIVQWIVDHPDLCPPIASTSASRTRYPGSNNLRVTGKTICDSDNDSTGSSDTMEGSSLQDNFQSESVKYATRREFETADQYAKYIRGLVTVGMTVRCCCDFEEIKKDDIGTVLKVDTEGLHDLNVQVDWQMHGGSYWVCFVHIEIMEASVDKFTEDKRRIVLGSQVQIQSRVSTPRYKWGLVCHGCVGIVTAINGKDITVKFPEQSHWTGYIDEMELATSLNNSLNANIKQNVMNATDEDYLISISSRCIRSLTVSSNESAAKYLLDRTNNFWQSCSNSQNKHWIRLEIFENILIHSLSVTVSPSDNSYMPSLFAIRVGNSISNLKDHRVVPVKPSDVNVILLSNIRQQFQWIEIVVKQCHNNGIQCRIHGINIIGRREQADLNIMLMNAGFLACEQENLWESNDSTDNSYNERRNSDESPCNVMVWGLNDKEQLGGLKGSKVKVPTFSQTLSRLRPIHIAGGSKSLFVVSQNGKVYVCGEGTNGRLGLGHNLNVSVPTLIPMLYAVKKVSVHSGGKHALALTRDGKVFSWGEGEDGKLGHGNRLTTDRPRLIESLRSKNIRDIACGSSHSAAITSSGELYTWGLGEYGRLGHGDNCTQLKPKLVTALAGKRVIQVACGSRDAQTLALTEEGLVFSWGDGDFGKLGRGGSEGSSVPHELERLAGLDVVQIECGAQFSLALTKSGEIWTWGKGDYYRLGHGTDQHVRRPAPIQGLRGKKVIHVAVGALHCLAVTDNGQVYAWGDNDHGQQGSGNTIVNKKPALVVGLDSAFANRVACGSSHSIAWRMPQLPDEDDKRGPVPFSSTKDPLGGSNLCIYDSDIGPKISAKTHSKHSLSQSILSLETFVAKQAALNYILNAMSILQARQLIISALTSHSNLSTNIRNLDEVEPHDSSIMVSSQTTANNEVIAQGGGEAPADLTELANNETLVDADMISTQHAPISAFQSLTGSLSLSTSASSVGPQKHSKMSASAMSVMAATMSNQEEMATEPEIAGLDDFTYLFGELEAKSLIELLKLSVAGRVEPAQSSQTIANTLIALGSNSPSIGSILIETCITELEDLCTFRHSVERVPKPVVQETCHPYIDDITLVGHVKIPGAESLRLEFDIQCSTEKRNDPLLIMDGFGRVIATRSGRETTQWAPEIRIQGDEMRWKFTSDSSVNGWGWRFWVHAIMPDSLMHELGSDRVVLSQPSIALVMALLNFRLGSMHSSILVRLASALSACAQLATLTTAQRIWALKKLHWILNSKHAPRPLDPSLNAILMPLVPEIYRQYEYEEPQVRGGTHLMHSEYFKTLIALACDMQLDSVLPAGDVHKWSWFRRYCNAVRVAQSLIRRTELPSAFCIEVRKKLYDMFPPTTNCHSLIDSANLLSTTTNPDPSPFSQLNVTSTKNNLTSCTSGFKHFVSSTSLIEGEQKLPTNHLIHEDHTVFRSEHDSQLLQWLNRRPEDWALSWGGASTIYGWGHNHRGQLGGLEGSRIKIPTPCEALSLIRPVQLAGGEQTLYAVTPDGKLFATGYGAGGRLGIGGIESVATPTLVESLQHVFVKKIAVNSGGKHCLALTTDGEVYSWGEGEDGKLGHGSRMSYDRPKLIEPLTGIGIADIACGSAHSACITSAGHVLTWGKGRYGRLGHGDSEDQLRPKVVEVLLGYRAIDIACGSGDAQTLCITDDDNVWSWGDGDYGKLGRGGSDGCKIPMKIESLSGLGVVKVECGSQFSIALTRSGAVYTWGKGDYHRLGHGTVDHVRRPKRVAALQGLKIVSIATGSLHCVACGDTGEVYTWGDNDEGQLGDGTVSAIQRPRLVNALQSKRIVKVTCGSAHTLALSTSQLSEKARPPPHPPLEYDLVRDLQPEALHGRLVLLHHFSELICPYLAMLPVTGDLSLTAMKNILVYSIKEAAFRKVVQTTMVRDKQHGPVIELNRIQVKRSRNKSGNGLAGVDGMKSVFGQMVQKLPLLTQEALSLPHRIWKVKFVGESVDDCGGGYSESIAEMCDELQNGSVPLLIPTPNGRGEAGANRDCFLLDPTLNSVLQMNMFRFLGVLMGVAVRTGSPLSLNLAEPVWRQLTGESLRSSDLTEFDRDYVAGLLCVRDMDDDPKAFSTLELPFSTSSAKGHEVPLSTRYTKITLSNRHEYVRLALYFRLHEFDEQVKAVRDGMSKVIPVPLLSLFSATELQAMVCGSPDIPLGLLKSVATYKGVDPNSPLVNWFWEVMEEFTNQERSLFLRFVWGRTRLPRTIADFRGRDFVLQVLDKYNPPDNFLPESYTCFFLLKMPRYSCKTVLLDKLKYAIHFCKSIDTDEYARVAIGDPTEATGTEDNSDVESVTSHGI